MVRMPERPVRNSVFAILRAMPLKRAVSTARRMPSMLAVVSARSSFWRAGVLARHFAIIARHVRRGQWRAMTPPSQRYASITSVRRVAGGGGAGIDDDRGEARFDDRRPGDARVGGIASKRWTSTSRDSLACSEADAPPAEACACVAGDLSRPGSPLADPTADLGVPADSLDRRRRIAHREDLLHGCGGNRRAGRRRRRATRNASPRSGTSISQAWSG